MRLLIGHTNMDLDCLGSLVLARHLFPGFQPVRSRLIHPIAKNLYNLYQNHLDFLPSRELRGAAAEEVKVFDARSYHRVKEFLEPLAGPPGRVEVYDHHGEDSCDIPGAILYEGDSGSAAGSSPGSSPGSTAGSTAGSSPGSNTALVASLLMEREVPGPGIPPEDATIALAGIFADTGNFAHGNVSAVDFAAAAFLMRQGADMNLVRRFIKTLKEEYQLTLFHSVLNRLIYQNIHGHAVMLCLMELSSQTNGLAPIAEKAFEVENPDALLIFFLMRKENRTLIVGRSQKDSIDLAALLKPWGGGGHAQAASALIKGQADRRVYDEVLWHLQETLAPAVTAGDVMSREVQTVHAEWTLLEASLFLEKVQHTGAPVVDGKGELCGFMTLRDISKGRKQGKMDHPVKGFMQGRVYSCETGATLREMEEIFFGRNIGHIPVVDGGRLAGIVTRSDYLGALRGGDSPESAGGLPLDGVRA